MRVVGSSKLSDRDTEAGVVLVDGVLVLSQTTKAFASPATLWAHERHF